ncbi:hypothetical protein VOLCADRAFT_92799 [Volvox carteri f. nagariensis]|uniref:Uncharacterized protein n=1 Tax=Volvox carteri f. nagariensis TaxID=3068 RepID=D8U0H7_VOLCA|nr:uncharacterized protein VOLCADRAFT_92799 [Volvox carteri f. nagariensis]EFJ46634.1 hypothetical protein VOLCADRAFT_92799 [Volvox carteri f. nagariensis]|eukprot:XP_002952163.1 hypothetical protein VOLCADRAFT_92799 [Volvox carteri f. nagariensis]
MIREHALRPVAVATIDYLFINGYTGTTANLTVEQWFRFNDFNRIESADFNVARYVEFMPAMQVDTLLAQNPEVGAILLNGVCESSARFCSAPGLERYTDIPSCMGFLASIPLFNPLRTQANSVACRFVHASLLYSAMRSRLEVIKHPTG